MTLSRRVLIDWALIVLMMLVGYPVLRLIVSMEVDRKFSEERVSFVEFAETVSEASPEVLDEVVTTIQAEPHHDPEPGPHPDPDPDRADGGADPAAAPPQ